jgi:hypothetical protein
MAVLRNLRYETDRDVNIRLNGCILRYKGQPVQLSLAGQLKVFWAALGEPFTDKQVIHSSDEYLDISSPPLGYVNQGGYVFYVSRIPHRKFKQGVCSDNVHIIHENPATRGHYRHPNRVILTPGMVNTINGVYPSLEEALGGFRDRDIQGVAFSRKLAFVKDMDLDIIKVRHMGSRTLAFCPIRGGKVVIPEKVKCRWAVETLNKAGIHV